MKPERPEWTRYQNRAGSGSREIVQLSVDSLAYAGFRLHHQTRSLGKDSLTEGSIVPFTLFVLRSLLETLATK